MWIRKGKKKREENKVNQDRNEEKEAPRDPEEPDRKQVPPNPEPPDVKDQTEPWDYADERDVPSGASSDSFPVGPFSQGGDAEEELSDVPPGGEDLMGE